MRRSSTRHWGRRGRLAARNSAPDEKVSTSNPAARISRLKALRTDASSSTMVTSDMLVVFRATLAGSRWKARCRLPRARRACPHRLWPPPGRHERPADTDTDTVAIVRGLQQAACRRADGVTLVACRARTNTTLGLYGRR